MTRIGENLETTKDKSGQGGRESNCEGDIPRVPPRVKETPCANKISLSVVRYVVVRVISMYQGKPMECASGCCMGVVVSGAQIVPGTLG